MNRSLASKAVSKEVKAGSKAAADSRGRDSRVKNLDRVASTAVSKSRGKADRVASAKLSQTMNFSPASAGDFFGPRAPFSRRVTLALVATGCGMCACPQPAGRAGRSILVRSILARRRETDLASG
jgi:hypothetical protein